MAAPPAAVRRRQVSTGDDAARLLSQLELDIDPSATIGRGSAASPALQSGSPQKVSIASPQKAGSPGLLGLRSPGAGDLGMSIRSTQLELTMRRPRPDGKVPAPLTIDINEHGLDASLNMGASFKSPISPLGQSRGQVDLDSWRSELLGYAFTNILSCPEAKAPPDKGATYWTGKWSSKRNCHYYWQPGKAAKGAEPEACWVLPVGAEVSKWSGSPETMAPRHHDPEAAEMTLRIRCVCGQVAFQARIPCAARPSRCHCRGCRRARACSFQVLVPAPGLELPTQLKALKSVASRCDELGAVQRHFCSYCGGAVAVSPKLRAVHRFDGVWDVRRRGGTSPALWRIQHPHVEYLDTRVRAEVRAVQWADDTLTFSLIVTEKRRETRYDVALRGGADAERAGAELRGSHRVSGGGMDGQVEEFDLVRSDRAKQPTAAVAAPPYLVVGCVEDLSIPAEVAGAWHAPTEWHLDQEPVWVTARPLCFGFQGFTGHWMKGGCGCGGCEYEASPFPSEVQHCYCKLCRQLTGSAFQTWLPCDASRFRWTRQKYLKLRTTTKQGRRHCCTQCGTSFTIMYNATPDKVWLAPGSLDDSTLPDDLEDQLYRVAHICCGWMPAWHAIPSDEQPRIRGPG